MTASSSSKSTTAPATLAALMQSDAAGEPVRYTGTVQPDSRYFDGCLPHAVGVHHIQVVRATRTPGGTGDTADGTGCTYNHQPYLVWWHGRFYLLYLVAPRSEHEAPTLTFWCSSADGYDWSSPQIAFPAYRLPAFHLDGVAYPAGMNAVMHQRMGFYVAPNDRLLLVGFYGVCPDSQHSPNAGNGVGRVVREMRADQTLGDIYFVRYNRHAGFDERNTDFPFYTASGDAEFRAACAALLADKLATLQWWEEDRGRDGFFAVDPSAVRDAPEFHAGMVSSEGAGKAFTWYTRPDGVIVGLWKNQYGALSPDGGRTWTPIARNRSLRTTGAKTWGQRTSDGRYAIVYNHSATSANRFPISALVGDDGRDFPTLLCLGGEVPPRRYAGAHKGPGMHYFRGISEGSAQPPGGDLWIAYSMNKEDIWVMRASVPLVAAEVAPPPVDEIARATAIADLSRWNFHLAKWAGAGLVRDPESGRNVLELRDEDSWDQASAERVFPAASWVRIQFRLQARAFGGDGSCEIEVQSQRHERPVRLRFSGVGFHAVGAAAPVPFDAHRWHAVEIVCHGEARHYSVRIDGATVCAEVPFAEPAAVVERIVFRTGPWRGLVPAHIADGVLAKQGRAVGDDLGPDAPEAPTVFWLTDVTTETT